MSVNVPDRELLRRLVAFDSTSSRPNLPIAEFVCDYLDRPGVEVVRNYGADLTRMNVFARKGPEEDAERAGLLLCGHLDVVGAEEPEWESEPFRLVEKEGRFIGRGTSDMKGFNALAMNVFSSIERRLLKRPLALLFTYGEELGSLGASRFAASEHAHRLPKSGIVGEPTSLRAVRLHKGHLKVRITVRGKSAHSGSPQLGENAIEPAAAIIRSLVKLRKEMEKERVEASEHFPEVPYPVLNVACVAGGSATNVIPERCTIDVGIRLLPGQSSEEVIGRIRERVEKSAGKRAELEVVGDNPPFLGARDSEVTREVCALLGQQEDHGASFASDAGVLARDLGCECVLFGPGSIEVAHRPNEWLAVAEFERAKAILVRLVERLCIE